MLVEFATVRTLYVANLLMRRQMDFQCFFVLADLLTDITLDVCGFRVVLTIVSVESVGGLKLKVIQCIG
jgi:hypothetical protein